MLPDPLHPAVVHFPIALAALVPPFAALCWIAIRTGRAPRASWALVVGLQALFAASAWFAEETGHDEEERVERIVEERHIEEHEAAAEWLVRLAAAGFVAAGVGLASGGTGAWGRGLALAFSLLALAAAVRTGHLGGELVYRYGAANAYLEPPAGSAPGASAEP